MIEYFIKFGSELTYGLNYILSNIFFCFCISYLFNSLNYRSVKNVLIHIADFIFTYGIRLLLVSFVYMLIGPLYMGLITWPILIFAHAFIMNKFSWYDRLMKAMTFSNYTILVFAITSNLGIIFTFWNETILFVIPFVVFSLILMKRFSLEDFKIVNWTCFVCEIIITLCTFTINIITNLIGLSQIPVGIQLTYNIILYVISGVTCYMFFKVTQEEKEAMINRTLAIKNNTDYQIAKLTRDNFESLKKMKHDMRSQYQFMQILLKNKDYEALDKYFSDMNEHSFVPFNFVNCGNNTISGIINLEINKAKENGLEITHTLLVPEHLSISDFDLTRFLINVIDNAIEATNRDEIKGEAIEIKIEYKQSFLFVNVTNKIKEGKDIKEIEKITTLKEDKDLHGYGKKIIDEIIEKYHGQKSTKIIDDRYIFNAMLRVEEITNEK